MEATKEKTGKFNGKNCFTKIELDLKTKLCFGHSNISCPFFGLIKINFGDIHLFSFLFLFTITNDNINSEVFELLSPTHNCLKMIHFNETQEDL